MKFSETDNKRYKDLLLQTYKDFAKFCNDNNIRYCAAGGTMIGAVRHQGFIPWDDDLDVYMKRNDYDKFISLRSKLVGTDYEIIDPSSDGYYCAHAKFSHLKSTIWEFRGIPFVFGVFIDIFVLDYEDGHYQDVVRKRINFAKKVNLFCISSNNHPSKEIVQSLINGHIKKSFWYVLQKLILNKYHMLLKRQVSKHSDITEGEWLIAYTGTSGKKDVFRSEWFDEYVAYPFEDTTIEIPCGYDEFLTAMFGDYMTLPTVEEQSSHHSLFYYNLDRRITREEVEHMQLHANQQD